MRQKSFEEVVRRDIERGVASSTKSKPVGRLQTANVIQTLLSFNTHAALRKAVYVGTTFYSAGRSGEAAFQCIDSGSFWGLDEERFY